MKTAVILFNLGGPDNLKAVKPFLFNLFFDPQIIRFPMPFRFFLAKWLSHRRAREASDIYRKLGGGSPIVSNTQKQQEALQAVLGEDYTVFSVMRYWNPRAEEVFHEVKSYNPDQVVLLPLYPQFSSTTTASSFKEWDDICRKNYWNKPTRKICCYPTQPKFIRATVRLLKDKLSSFSNLEKVRVLFSAHGLPQRIVDQGDPYQWQVEKSVFEILKYLNKQDLDYVICYQSRVGPLKWLEPYTDVEITRAGKEGKSIVILPVSFVSEHSETLYELDIQYKNIAAEEGVPRYERVST
ncbi:MAG: ferrochelatase, partial [Alphaproteobacteria bacterium]|nr:ferrochelatase [Alphaproteobacteria bacterium]